jgi:hypothetical protein
VGHILWLAKAKPPTAWGSYLYLLARAGLASSSRGRFADPELTLVLQTAPVAGCEYKSNTTLNNGYLGSRNDEERSEMRYLV